MENKDKYTRLKEEYLGWLKSIEIRRIAYEQAKSNLKQREKDLTISKKIFNLTYKDWKQARIEAERSKRRWKGYPYKIRQWAKNHMDKVFDSFDKQSIDKLNSETERLKQ
jgi:selenocysteine-specific translation elongation factor